MKKILFAILFVFLLLNLVGMIAILSYGLATGRFDREKVEQYSATWRGEKLVPFVEDVQAEEKQDQPRDSQARIEQTQIQREIVDRELQKQIELLRSMQVTIAEARAKLDSELKALQGRQQEFDTKLAAHNKATGNEGFQKALKSYSAMKPKSVKDDLMAMTDEEAIRYLAAMKSTVATDVLDQFRTPQELEKRLRLMQMPQRLQQNRTDFDSR